MEVTIPPEPTTTPDVPVAEVKSDVPVDPNACFAKICFFDGLSEGVLIRQETDIFIGTSPSATIRLNPCDNM